MYRGSDPDGVAAAYSNQVGTPTPRSWEYLFAFVKSCGEAFLPAYLPIAQRRRKMEYGDRERNFQIPKGEISEDIDIVTIYEERLTPNQLIPTPVQRIPNAQ